MPPEMAKSHTWLTGRLRTLKGNVSGLFVTKLLMPFRGEQKERRANQGLSSDGEDDKRDHTTFVQGVTWMAVSERTLDCYSWLCHLGCAKNMKQHHDIKHTPQRKVLLVVLLQQASMSIPATYWFQHIQVP